MNWNSILVKIGLFVAYIIIVAWFFYTKGAVRLKKQLWPPFVVLTYTVIAGFVYFQNKDSWTLVAFIVFGILICFFIIRCNVSFCNSCGCTAYDRTRLTTPTECPKCGAKLN
jgi:hypothetical protein